MVTARESTSQQIASLVNEWAEAELRGDAAALGRLLADDFIGIGPAGFMLTREQWLARYDAQGLHYDTFTVSETQTRLYDGAAIVTGRQQQTGSLRDRPELYPGGRLSLVWVRQGDDWRLAGWQLSPIMAPGA